MQLYRGHGGNAICRFCAHFLQARCCVGKAPPPSELFHFQENSGSTGGWISYRGLNREIDRQTEIYVCIYMCRLYTSELQTQSL